MIFSLEIFTSCRQLICEDLTLVPSLCPSAHSSLILLAVVKFLRVCLPIWVGATLNTLFLSDLRVGSYVALTAGVQEFLFNLDIGGSQTRRD